MTVIFQDTLQGENETCQLAGRLAELVQPGDLIALSGDLGAGKSTFARAFIRVAAGIADLDVPSPTFTLVQTYESASGTPILHADLYRLEGPGDVDDLGLAEEKDDSILLVEWPDRMPENWWQAALRLDFTLTDTAGKEARALIVSAMADEWQDRLKPVLSEKRRPE